MTTLAFASALIAGCGGVGDLSGKVTYKGKVVASGSVMVLGSDRQLYYGAIHQDGRFEIPKVPRGEASVAVNSPDPKALYLPQANKVGKKGPPASPPDPKLWFPLPAKVGDAATSGIKINVVEGPNTVALDLKD